VSRRIWSAYGAQFGEEFGEVLFSILAVEEQTDVIDLRIQFSVHEGIR
jgi:hypothetical protein